MAIPSGTFSEWQIPRKLRRLNLTSSIWRNQTHYTMKVWKCWLLVLIKRKTIILAGIESARRSVIFRITTNERIFVLLVITILLPLLMNLTQIQIRFISPIASPTPIQICRTILQESKKMPTLRTFSTEIRYAGHLLGISVNILLLQAKRKILLGIQLITLLHQRKVSLYLRECIQGSQMLLGWWKAW